MTPNLPVPIASIPALRRRLALRLNRRTVLLTMDMVRAVRGADAESVAADVDCGRLRWVWNVAVRPGDARELRFLAREIALPRSCQFSAAQALTLVTGSRPRYRSNEVCQLLFVSRATLMRLFEAGELGFEMVNGMRWVTRESLAHFFTRRLEGVPEWEQPATVAGLPAPDPAAATVL